MKRDALATSADRRGPAYELLLAFLLLGLVIAAYFPALKAGFIWDDDSHLTQNPCIVGPLGLKDIWTSKAARICPLVQTTFWMEHMLWGFSPFPYHLVNILVHGGSVVVLWAVLRNLKIHGAWLAAAAWAVHPIQTETVAWVTELKNTQSGLFFLLSVLFFVRSLPGKGVNPAAGRAAWLYALSLFCGALAMASKSSTVILPVVLGLCIWWIDGEWKWPKATKIAPFLLFSLGAGLLSIWTQHLEGANQPQYALGKLQRIAIAGKVFWFYLGKLIWPHPLTFIYPRWEIDASRVTTYWPAAAAALVLFVSWYYRKRKLRPLFFALAYYIAALFPVLGLLEHYFLRYSFVGDHFQYLAGIGPLTLLAAGISTSAGFLNRAHLVRAALYGILLFPLCVLTWNRCAMFNNSETLWRDTIAQNPRCWMALNNLGILLIEKGQPDEAITFCNEALNVRPDYPQARITLGNALLQKHRPDEAIEEYRKALDARFDEGENIAAKAYYNLGNAFLQKGRFEEAVKNYETALQLPSEYSADVHNNLGEAFLRQGRVNEAVAQYEKVVVLRAFQPPLARSKAFYNLANALVQGGRLAEAIPDYRKAVELNPGYADGHNNLARALIKSGQFREAIAHYQTALELSPQSPLAQNNLAWQLATCPDPALRDGARAVALAQQASQLSGGKDPLVLNTLAAALAEDGQFTRATETAEEALRLAGPDGDPALLEFLRRAIDLYQAGSPYHAAAP